jgi:hypothetical protein
MAGGAGAGARRLGGSTWWHACTSRSLGLDSSPPHKAYSVSSTPPTSVPPPPLPPCPTPDVPKACRTAPQGPRSVCHSSTTGHPVFWPQHRATRTPSVPCRARPKARGCRLGLRATRLPPPPPIPPPTARHGTDVDVNDGRHALSRVGRQGADLKVYGLLRAGFEASHEALGVGLGASESPLVGVLPRAPDLCEIPGDPPLRSRPLTASGTSSPSTLSGS